MTTFPILNRCRKHHECCEKSLTPDEAVFRSLATVYAQNHPAMKTGNNCNETFPGGIVNGAYWYELNGRFCRQNEMMVEVYLMCDGHSY